MFINLNTVRSLNVCNAVKSVCSTHYIRRVFPVTHDVHLNVFTLLTVYILLFLTNKHFVDVVYKHVISGKYLSESYKSLSAFHSLFPSIYYLSNVFIG